MLSITLYGLNIFNKWNYKNGKQKLMDTIFNPRTFHNNFGPAIEGHESTSLLK